MDGLFFFIGKYFNFNSDREAKHPLMTLRLKYRMRHAYKICN